MDRQEHWDAVYASKDEAAVSWYQPTPLTSLKLIQEHVNPGARLVDVGSGASRLIDYLVDRGFRVTALDISETALAKARSRLGARAADVEWVVADLTAWRPPRQFDVWHDRAVFHFLTEERDRAAYTETMSAAVMPGGHAVIGTFALDGPQQCSGLPVRRYDAAGLAATFSHHFTLIDQLHEPHRTPAGTTQNFQFAVLRRR